MAKHLPPSAATLRLLDIDGAAGDILAQERADLNVVVVSGGDPSLWSVDADSFDSVVAYNAPQDSDFLDAVLRALRPGGRFIRVSISDDPGADVVTMLEKAGYTRILVETGIECPLPVGALMRGEKPHITDDTLERVRVASNQDADLLNWDTFNGRYVHLLIRQLPNKPAWKITRDDVITWEAAVINGDQLLGFSSLPKAVSFMQEAVLANQIDGVNKVAKFSRATAETWTQPIKINPSTDVLHDGVGWISMTPPAPKRPMNSSAAY
jgi:hypothetical protein